MRTRAIVVAMVAVCFTSLASVEAAPRPRRVLVPYTFEDVNHQFSAPGVGLGVWSTDDAYTVDLEKGEKAVSVMILDDREGPVSGVIVQWTTDYEAGGASVGHAVTYARFCTKTEAPVPVDPEIPVEILVKKGTCDDGTPSVPTSGDIVVDFHRKL